MANFSGSNSTSFLCYDCNNGTQQPYDFCLSHTEVTDVYWRVYDPTSNKNITAVVVCQFLISIIGTIWNFIVLATILIHKLFKDPTYIFILNLVAADLLLCGLILPFNKQSSLNREFSLGQSDYARCQSCQTIGALFTIFIFVLYFTLALLALDRLVFIKWPFKYSRYVSVKLAVTLIIIVWILNVVLAILPVIGFGVIHLNVLNICTPVLISNISLSIIYYVMLILVGLVPFSVSLVANIWILCFAYKIAHKNRQSQCSTGTNVDLNNTSEESWRFKERILFAKLFGAFFIINMVLFLPFIIAAVLLGILRKEEVHKPVIIIATVVLYLIVVIQPAVHPILETCIIGKATKVMSKFLCCCFSRGSHTK